MSRRRSRYHLDSEVRVRRGDGKVGHVLGHLFRCLLLRVDHGVEEVAEHHPRVLSPLLSRAAPCSRI